MINITMLEYYCCPATLEEVYNGELIDNGTPKRFDVLVGQYDVEVPDTIVDQVLVNGCINPEPSSVKSILLLKKQ